MAKQLFPSVVFYFILRTIVRRIARKKRDQAKRSSFVKIKGNDIIATTKIFYSLVIIPLILTAYVVAFGMTAKIVFGKTWGQAARLSFLMAFILPIYLYVCIAFSYEFAKYARGTWNQIRFRLLDRQTMTFDFKDLLRQKLELEAELLALIRAHKPELKDYFDKQLTQRNLEEEVTSEKIQSALAKLG